jgi:signal transduction histidine kinase
MESMHEVMHTMFDRKRITARELEEGLLQELVFSKNH